MNFFDIGEKMARGVVEIYPRFHVTRASDLMIRGKNFYAIWDEKKQTWSTDEYDVPRLVDEELQRYFEANKSRFINGVKILYLTDFSSRAYLDYKKFVNTAADNYHPLDSKLIFANQTVKKTDYASKSLPYALEPGPHDAYDELVSTLYSEWERRKFEWAIGSIIAGESKKIQKFFVFYGEGGTGKSTILNIIQKLFDGYCVAFDAKALGSSSNQFAMEVFKSNPLVAVQHDGDLSKIEDNTRLNQIIAHEELVINEKNKALYSMKINSMLFMGTNTPVKITNSKSGIIRRLVDIYPTGEKIPFKRYTELMSRIEFELPGIAQHCLEVYREMGGRTAYSDYKPRGMIYETDFFYNYVEENYFNFKEADGVTLKAAYELYKNFCDYNGAKKILLRNEFCAELKSYFRKFQEITRVDGKQVRSWYSGFRTEKFNLEKENDIQQIKPSGPPSWLELNMTESRFDREYSDIPAQGAKLKDGKEIPVTSWNRVKTKLRDILTTEVHYCKPPDDMIVIDFDLKDKEGNKSREKNLEAAAKWPPTYAEWSKGGAGLHLHYIYSGDPLKLSSVYGEDIEVKIFKPKDNDSVGGSLRRKLSFCNDIPIAIISSGLPLREEKQMLDVKEIKSEKTLRSRIRKALNKEYEPHHTVTSIDYIYNDLERCYSSGMKYDVRDLRPDIMAFANNSTHNADYCLRVVSRMHFHSEEAPAEEGAYEDDILIFYDVEVFPNLFLINWKRAGDTGPCMRMINPSAADVEELAKFKLVGFNCRRYDNHILWARMLGYTNEQLFLLSQRIISGSKNAFFGEAYNLSYTDVYDFCAKKQGLKKWEIELGIHHQELGLPWDEPVPEEKWIQVAEYCDNDVIATEAVFNANQADFRARQILAELSKMLTGYGTVNDTTNQLTTRIILRGDKNANKQFVYPDLTKEFPGYEFNPLGFPEEKYEETFEKQSGKKLAHKSYYRGCDPSEGGRVYANKGAYANVVTFDVASMHPSSIIAENGFGKYTKNFKDLLDIRLAIKHKDYEKAKTFFDGALAPYLTDAKAAKQLSFALKIAINSVYGLTSAKFDNALRDPRNIDNWVAKRGALFMIDLQKDLEEMGVTVVHVKTDSIKVVNPSPDIYEYIIEYGLSHGYTFEIEAVYDRICLVNRAVYIARYSMEHPDEEERWKWTATGDQFKQPYIFKTLFSKEPIEFKDMCETKTVQTALYLDMNERLDKNEHDYKFIGRAGLFCPMVDGAGGGELLRDAGDGKFAYAEGAKGYRWMEAEMVNQLGLEDKINREYYNRLVDEAKDDISQFTDFERFVADEPFVMEDDTPPWD